MRALAFVGSILVAACADAPPPDPVDTGGDPEAPRVPDDPDPFEDLDPDPAVFEADLRARAANVGIGPEVVRALTYGARLPGPEIRVQQGDRVRIHLTNALPEGFPTTIHWHGIEGNNASDGTPTTQEPIAVGETFTYDFVAPRPGIYWFHPHVRGAQSTHSGLYGTLIVEDPDEEALVDMGVLPSTRYAAVLSDLGTYEGAPIDVEVDDGMLLMNGTEGEHLLVNGQVRPTFEVPAGDGVRLQLVNASIARYWVLSIPGHTIFRVGGQGGLLERARVEGGEVTGAVLDEVTGEAVGEEHVDLGFARGEVLLAPGERADVVVVPQGEVGDEIPLRWEDFARGRHGMWMEDGEMVMGDAPDDGERPGVEVASLRIVQGSGDYAIAEGDPVLQAVGRGIAPVDIPPDALDFTGPHATAFQETMEMVEDDGAWEHIAGFYIDDVSWMPTHAGPAQPDAPSARYATLGDTIVWEIRNTTSMAHPFHLHGFSYQPIAFIRHGEGDDHGHGDGGHDDAAGTVTRWEVDHVEFQDTTHLPARTSLLMHVEIDDPVGEGGAVGRWMKHCHIFQHGESGMMSELIVSP